MLTNAIVEVRLCTVLIHGPLHPFTVALRRPITQIGRLRLYIVVITVA